MHLRFDSSLLRKLSISLKPKADILSSDKPTSLSKKFQPSHAFNKLGAYLTGLSIQSTRRIRFDSKCTPILHMFQSTPSFQIQFSVPELRNRQNITTSLRPTLASSWKSTLNRQRSSNSASHNLIPKATSLILAHLFLYLGSLLVTINLHSEPILQNWDSFWTETNKWVRTPWRPLI